MKIRENEMENIRLATEDDFEFIAELETFISKQNSEGYPDIYKYTKESIPKDMYLKEISNENMYVLEIDNNKIGFYWAQVTEIENVRIKYQKIYYIISIVLKQEFIGKGYGKKLFKYIENKAKSNGCKTIELSVDNYNKRALRFYKNIGMEEKNIIMRKIVE